MRITIIACYFGKLKNINSWIYSCSKNPEYNFLLVTDQNYSNKTPKNVRIIKTSFSKVVEDFEKKLGFKIALDKPYKLCDYKPLYGYLFENYLSDSNYWGYCDTDLFFGNLKNFIPHSLIAKYERLYVLGHLSIYKNNKKMNELFLKDQLYKKMCSSNKIFIYDEKQSAGINALCKKYKVKQYNSVDYADISPNLRRITLAAPDDRVINHKPNFNHQLFAYRNGKVVRYYIHNNKVETQEFAYLHFSTRHYEDTISTNFLITPKKLVPIPNDKIITKKEIIKYNRFHGAIYEKIEFLFNFIRRRIINYRRYYR